MSRCGGLLPSAARATWAVCRARSRRQAMSARNAASRRRCRPTQRSYVPLNSIDALCELPCVETLAPRAEITAYRRRPAAYSSAFSFLCPVADRDVCRVHMRDVATSDMPRRRRQVRSLRPSIPEARSLGLAAEMPCQRPPLLSVAASACCDGRVRNCISTNRSTKRSRTARLTRRERYERDRRHDTLPDPREPRAPDVLTPPPRSRLTAAPGPGCAATLRRAGPTGADR